MRKEIAVKMKRIITVFLVICLMVLTRQGLTSVVYANNIENNNSKIGELISSQKYEGFRYDYYSIDGIEKAYIVMTNLSMNTSETIYRDFDKIYRIDGLNRIEIASINDSMTIDSNLFLINSEWGSMLKKDTYIRGATNAEIGTVSLAVTLITLAFGLPMLGAAYDIAASLVAMLTPTPQDFRITATYYEYSGCPQYKKYTKQTIYTPSGSIKKSVTDEQLVFTGVHNSPENPPVCRQLGF